MVRCARWHLLRKPAERLLNPTSRAPAIAFTRRATATLLYSAIAATNRFTAPSVPSFRASQQAQRAGHRLDGRSHDLYGRQLAIR